MVIEYDFVKLIHNILRTAKIVSNDMQVTVYNS